MHDRSGTVADGHAAGDEPAVTGATAGSSRRLPDSFDLVRRYEPDRGRELRAVAEVLGLDARIDADEAAPASGCGEARDGR